MVECAACEGARRVMASRKEKHHDDDKGERAGRCRFTGLVLSKKKKRRKTMAAVPR